MTDDRPTDDIAAMEHDEYHSALEIDDTSGWRVFLVPGLALLFVLGAILMVLLMQGDAEPDPRIAARLEAKQAEEKRTTPAPAVDPTAPAQRQ
jgi:hypothetical protein